jgi:hypothetical protein
LRQNEIAPDGRLPRNHEVAAQLVIGVGIVIARDPLHGPGRALLSASGSYRRCVAAKRASGKGWSVRGGGSHRSAKASMRVQEMERL